MSLADLSGYVATLCSVLLLLAAAHRLRLAVAAMGLRIPALAKAADAACPSVLVQLPVYNERSVIAAAIDALARLDYPTERWRLQIVDDSTDDTSAIIAARVDHWRALGRRIEHRRREHRRGFKAGALAAGLEDDDAELVAIFDADFLPAPDFLRCLVPHLAAPDVGMVQARWDYHNRDASPLTAAQGVLLDAHFLNEHAGRAALAHFFNFNGTAGVWRRRCIDDAGGWSGRTLTEDLDLSYRAQLRGWRFVFLPAVVVPSELPQDAAAFRQQQYRWTHGAVTTARYLFGPIWRERSLPVGTRLAATMHLGASVAAPLVLAWVTVLSSAAGPAWLANLGWAATILVALTHAAAAWRRGAGWSMLWQVPASLLLGAGLVLTQTQALVAACLGRGDEFRRTPKGAGAAGAYRLGKSPMVLAELLLAAGLLASTAWHGWHGAVALTLLPLLVALGSAWMAVATLVSAGDRLLRELPDTRIGAKTLTGTPGPKTI